ncbi:MAG TPA: hypothetical protein VJ550_13815 [Geomonas sp.]|nr:hypothetical protein [Geomonas sp.]
MKLALQCKFYGHLIDIDKALAIKEAAQPDLRNTLPFQCADCGKQVRPRIAGDKHVAHFVHVQENPDCSYTDPAREY